MWKVKKRRARQNSHDIGAYCGRINNSIIWTMCTLFIVTVFDSKGCFFKNLLGGPRSHFRVFLPMFIIFLDIIQPTLTILASIC